ncbi:MAG: ABC transporter ATP-binding protein [Candidatus Leucobacter sulfamidivorax]|nr:ABC transporter ATP-binding protein [Candidatus Leucobacter sulfamidivorax]
MQAVVRDVSFTLSHGEALALVGESGAGKSMTARALLGMLPRGAKQSGAVRVDGESVFEMSRKALSSYRTKRITMIFQDPRAHINPVRTIGDFLTEALRTNLGWTREAAEERVIGLLDDVGVPHARRRMRQYPHELSGGLLQRVMIAAALAPDPDIIVADEPTTALDVTTQAEVMAILSELQRERRLALVFVTHDLELAAAVCDRTAVMYAGRVVETQGSERLHSEPAHPYTAALLGSRPQMSGDNGALVTIPGRPVSAFEAPAGCSFADRCVYSQDACRASSPRLRPWRAGEVACFRVEELHGSLVPEGAPDA